VKLITCPTLLGFTSRGTEVVLVEIKLALCKVTTVTLVQVRQEGVDPNGPVTSPRFLCIGTSIPPDDLRVIEVKRFLLSGCVLEDVVLLTSEPSRVLLTSVVDTHVCNADESFPEYLSVD
jgi:hypothetical protein